MANKTVQNELPVVPLPEIIDHVPLYLIPRVIADQIRKNGETIAYIEMRRGAGGCFTITVYVSLRRVYRQGAAQEPAGAEGGSTSV